MSKLYEKLSIPLTVYFLFSWPLMAQAQQQTTLKFSGATNSFSQELVREFAADIERKTNGSLTVKYFPDNQLGRDRDVRNQLLAGGVDLAAMQLWQFQNEAQVFGVDAVPFSAMDKRDARTLDDFSRPFVERELNTKGLSVLLAAPTGTHLVLTKQKPSSINDFRNLNWGAADPATTAFAKALGASSVNIQSSEVPRAMSQGAIGVAIASADATKSLDNVPFISSTAGRAPKNFVLISQQLANRLTKEHLDALVQSAHAMEEKAWNVWDDQNRKTLDQLKARGNGTFDLSSSVRGELNKIGIGIAADYCARCTGGTCTHPRIQCKDDTTKCCDP